MASPSDLWRKPVGEVRVVGFTNDAPFGPFLVVKDRAGSPPALCCEALGARVPHHFFSGWGQQGHVRCTGWRCQFCKLTRVPRAFASRTSLGLPGGGVS